MEKHSPAKDDQHRTFAIHNFGCKVNQEEGGALAALFCRQGWRQDNADPALIIINTCTVTAVADKKSRNLIRRLRREHPGAVIAVCGCYAQRAAAEIAALDGVDIIAGVEERRYLPQLLAEYLAEDRLQPPLIRVAPIADAKAFHRIADTNIQGRERAYLKIEDGCDQFCHYCVIPYVRGPVRSLPPNQALEQASALIDAGHREIVLSGIHIGAYGQDLPAGHDLPALLKSLLALPGLGRLRLGSIEPQQFTPALRQLIAEEPRICPHLHIPLQSGCDRTLAAMGRRYDTAAYAALLGDLLSLRPELAFTTDVIVGYPGESAEDFESTAAFIRSLPLSALHVFPYSRRSGTVAASLTGQLPNSVKEERSAALLAIAREKALSFGRSQEGKCLDMLGEEIAELDGKRWLKGRAGNYLNLLLPWDQPEPYRDFLAVIGEKMTDKGMVVRLQNR